MSIIVLARLKAAQGKEKAVKADCLSLVEPTRSEAGCISYDLHQNSDDSASFMFYEQWVSKEALDEHLRTPYLQGFIAKADTLLAGPLDVTIWQKLS
jgi:quinol monooxygenase YgiN